MSQNSYEEVVYCTVCGAELSRETKTIPVVGHEHEYTVKVTKEPTCEEVGVKLYICSLCGDGYTEDIPKTAHEDADNDGKCDTCGQQMTGGDHCKYCGKIHGGAFGWLVKFFHSILAIFKR